MVFSKCDLCVIKPLIAAPKKRGSQWIGSSTMRGNAPPSLVLRVISPVLAAMMFFAVPAQAAPPAVEKVRVQTHPGFTRVVLETNAPIEPNLFTMNRPNRLVIDLPELAWKIPRPSGAVDNALVRKYSFGLFQPGVSRLVLDLSGPTQVMGRKLSQSGRGFLYEIDLANLPSSLPPNPQRQRTDRPESASLGSQDLPGALTVDPATKSVFKSRSFDPATAEYGALADIFAAALKDGDRGDPLGEAFAAASLDADAIPDLAPERDGAGSIDRASNPGSQDSAAEIANEIDKMEPERSNRPPLRVVIDPGHGGRDPGTGSDSGVNEKDINLAFAKILANLLRADPHYEVFLTREKDIRVKLEKRVQFARQKNADLFISIHADWNMNKFAKGATAYTLSEKASVEALDSLATKKDEVGRVAGVDLAAEREDVARLLVDLARRDTQARSLKFAELVVGEVAKETPVLRRPLRRDSFHVLKAPDMPSVLLELGFLSNETDRKRLESDVWRLKTAGAVKRAIDEFRRVTGARGFANQ